MVPESQEYQSVGFPLSFLVAHLLYRNHPRKQYRFFQTRPPNRIFPGGNVETVYAHRVFNQTSAAKKSGTQGLSSSIFSQKARNQEYTDAQNSAPFRNPGFSDDYPVNNQWFAMVSRWEKMAIQKPLRRLPCYQQPFWFQPWFRKVLQIGVRNPRPQTGQP